MLGKIQATVAEGASKVADRLSGSHGAGGHTHGATGTCLGGTTVEKCVGAGGILRVTAGARERAARAEPPLTSR